MPAQQRPEAVVNFVGLVRALPPEFHADLLLKLAESNHLAQHQQWRRELLEEAFQIAQRAPEAYPSRGGLHTDTRAFVTAGEFGMDSLSLRLRSTTILLPLDPGRAAAMFCETPIPALPEFTCQSALIPDFEKYYEVLAAVHKSGFTARERERGEPHHLVKAAMDNLQSPAQVEPFSRMLFQLEIPKSERQELADALGAALARISPSDRLFLRHSTACWASSIPRRKTAFASPNSCAASAAISQRI